MISAAVSRRVAAGAADRIRCRIITIIRWEERHRTTWGRGGGSTPPTPFFHQNQRTGGGGGGRGRDNRRAMQDYYEEYDQHRGSMGFREDRRGFRGDDERRGGYRDDNRRGSGYRGSGADYQGYPGEDERRSNYRGDDRRSYRGGHDDRRAPPRSRDMDQQQRGGYAGRRGGGQSRDVPDVRRQDHNNRNRPNSHYIDDRTAQRNTTHRTDHQHKDNDSREGWPRASQAPPQVNDGHHPPLMQEKPRSPYQSSGGANQHSLQQNHRTVASAQSPANQQVDVDPTPAGASRPQQTSAPPAEVSTTFMADPAIIQATPQVSGIF